LRKCPVGQLRIRITNDIRNKLPLPGLRTCWWNESIMLLASAFGECPEWGEEKIS
jgi:hypothetical protein